VGLYNADGNINLTSVTGATRTGLFAANGSWNIVINDGTQRTGLYHACGAFNAVVTTNISSGYYAPNGSMYVMSDGAGGYILNVRGTLPSAFVWLYGSDGQYLLGNDGQQLYGRAP